jgi:hypothetical protein
MAQTRKKAEGKQRYVVNVSLEARDVSKAGAAVTVEVRDGSTFIGTVQIGQGSFGWKGAHGRNFKRIPWSTLASRLDDM